MVKGSRFTISIALVLCFCSLSLAQQQQPGTVGQEATIAWTATPANQPEVAYLYQKLVTKEAGEQLTSGDYSDIAPNYSPDGQKLTFHSHRMGKSMNVFVLDLNTKAITQLTHSEDFAGFPKFSPNGQEIIYQARLNGKWDIFIISINGGEPKRVGNFTSSATRPSWSPDGKSIVFSMRSSIQTVNADGTDLRQLHAGSNASFSPDGKQILLENNGAIGLMNSDGSGYQRLSPWWANDSNASFHSKGRYIVFESNSVDRTSRALYPNLQISPGSKIDLYLMEIVTRRTWRLTADPGNNELATWNPMSGEPLVSQLSPSKLEMLPSSKSYIGVDAHFRSNLGLRGEFVYAGNDLKNPPFQSFLELAEFSPDVKRANFLIQGLKDLALDVAFDPIFAVNSSNVVVKLGNPIPFPGDVSQYSGRYNLWLWRRETNDFSALTLRELYFPTYALAPDGTRLAYIAGGNALGQTPEENGGIGEPLRLFVYNPQTQQETLVSDNQGVRGGFAWLDATTLLYTAVPTPVKSALNPHTFARPAIYAFDVTSGKSTLLLNEARHPIPSPDGSRFIFWGLGDDEEAVPLPDTWWQNTGYAKLSVANRDGSGRKTYGRILGAYPSLVWASDNQQVFWLRQSAASPQAAASMETWNVVTNKARMIGKLAARDAEETERAWFQPQFRALNVAPDGKTLFVAVEEVAPEGAVVTRVQAVDVESGTSREVAQLQNAAGFDWRAVAPEK